jgi:hypothetical protein
MAQQRYVSSELTHFVGGREPPDEHRYGVLVKILNSGWLTHPPHQQTLLDRRIHINPDARLSSNELFCPNVICFCDIPLADLPIHMAKYSKFGLAFTKSFLADRGATPVFYVARDAAWLPEDVVIEALGEQMPRHGVPSEQQRGFLQRLRTDRRPAITIGGAFDTSLKPQYLDLVAELLGRDSPLNLDQRKRLKGLHELLCAGVFSFLKFFDHEKADDDLENFYMEREWRKHGNLRFELTDVRRVMVPEQYAKRLRDDVPGYFGQVTFAEGPLVPEDPVAAGACFG